MAGATGRRPLPALLPTLLLLLRVASRAAPAPSAASRAAPGPFASPLLAAHEARVEETCGSGAWFHGYARRHAETLRSTPASEWRVAAYRCHDLDEVQFNPRVEDRWCGGLGDRLPGVVSMFLVAQLTGRVFLLDWWLADRAFEKPHFDWAYPSKGVPTFGRDVYFSVVRYNEQAFHQILDNQLRDKGSGRLANESRVVSLTLARGRAAQLFDMLDPAYTKSIQFRHQTWRFEGHGAVAQVAQLRAAGVRRATVFGCTLNLLFRPAAAVRSLFGPYARALTSPRVCSIGIHIRTSDVGMFSNSSVELSDFQAYWDKAERLQAEVCGADEHVVWLLLSDHDGLKRAAKRAMRHILVTHITPFHIHKAEIGFSIRRKGLKGFDYARQPTPVEALRSSVGEWWLFSLCQYFVFDPRSGFSRTAAAYSLRPGNVVVIAQEPTFRRTDIDSLRAFGSGF